MEFQNNPTSPEEGENQKNEILKTDTENEAVEIPQSADFTEHTTVDEAKPEKKRFGQGFFAFIAAAACVILALSVILTYTLTAAAKRDEYTKALLAKEAEINALHQSMGDTTDEELFRLIFKMLSNYSYYAPGMSKDEMIHAALNAYVTATGDRYAAYYTVEEFEALTATNENYAGIGVATVTATQTVGSDLYLGYIATRVYNQSPAERAGIKKGDFIYKIKVDGEFRTVEELGGYEMALTYIRGEVGTSVEIEVLRKNEPQPLPFSIVRETIEISSVTYGWKNDDKSTKVAVLTIDQFDLTTPKKLRESMDVLLAEGAEHFVFDLRNNPGGDLLSIKAVMSYFLQENDKIIDAIDKDGKVVTTYRAEPMEYVGRYADCNVKREEIGMYRDLDMVVLCNGNTASAAEVFTATMRDYGLATIVGETTFGKGIMQTVFDLSSFGDFTGYLKVTSHAYVTQCGVTYHDVGIKPDDGYYAELTDEDADNQLQLAFSVFED